MNKIYIECEATKDECHIDIYDEEGYFIETKSEPLKYCYEDGYFHPDGIQFEELDLSKEAREHIEKVCNSFIYNLDEEDFAPADMR